MNESPDSLNVLGPSASPPGPVKRCGQAAGIFGWLGRFLPTLLVLVALGVLAYWGHHTGWAMPKFSSLAGDAMGEKDDWCGEHDVPESLCVECNPELFPQGKDYGWCKKHGVQNCPLCHPEVAQLEGTPRVSQADLERAERALALRERPENNRKCPLYRRRIQFTSAEDASKAGVDVDVAQERPMTESLTANGEITYDQTRVARLTARVPGTVWRIEKELGQPVQMGEVLALVDGAEVGKAKGEFLQALAQVNLASKTFESMRQAIGAIPEARLRESETALEQAQIRLLSAQQAMVNLGLPIPAEDLKGLPPNERIRRVQFLGLPEAVTRTLDPKTTTANLIPVKAPFGGVIAAREAVAGEVVDTTKTLFVVADVSRVWLTLSVRQEDAQYLALGQPVRFRVDGGAVDATGQIAWIATAADEKSRTLKVRADFPNPEGRLLANTFGAGRIILREEKNTVVVPNEALQWDGSCNVVFVRDRNYLKAGAPKVFHTRTVRPGAKDEECTEIIVGLLPGEVVATKGSGVLRAELLKNNLGVG